MSKEAILKQAIERFDAGGKSGLNELVLSHSGTFA